MFLHRAEEKNGDGLEISNKIIIERSTFPSVPGLPDFSFCNTPKRGIIYQMTTKYTEWP
jgi:hypothetical protein